MFKFWKRKAAEPAVPSSAPAPSDAVAPPAVDARAPAVGARDGVATPEAPGAPPAPIAPPVETEAAAAQREQRSWRERLRGSGLGRAFGSLFARHPRLDDELLDELETTLITADVGVAATGALIDDLRRRLHAREFADARGLLGALRAELLKLLAPVAKPLEIDPAVRPFVLMVVGVNGVGKTTTIGKLAQNMQREGAAVMLAAGDTFRAAAVQQLEAWGTRNRVPVIAQGEGADSASVIFDALQAARARGIDVLIADTAGRLHTKSNLMEELAKIRRVLAKIDPAAPHETLMVIDGTTGQNAISQVRQFHQSVRLTGLAVTKLDGSAKGGVLFALAREFGLPIRYVGVGESLEDLHVFDPEAFVDGLLPERIGAEA